MKVTYVEAEVTLNKMAKTPIKVPAWELPVVQACWGDDVDVVGEFEVERELPEASDEFQRLATRYGPRFGDVPFVAGVYGNFGPGINSLRDEIQRSVVKPAAAESGPVAAGGMPVAELGLDEGGDPEIDTDELAALIGDDAAIAGTA